MRNVSILNVKVTDFSKAEFLKAFSNFLDEPTKQHRYMVKPNPEIIMHAQKNPSYQAALNNALWAIPDGVGLAWAAKTLTNQPVERIGNVDLMIEMVKLCAQKKKSIGLLGATQETVEKTSVELTKQCPTLNIAFVHNGFFSPQDEKNIVAQINRSNVSILFVATGFPKQENFIAEYAQILKVKLAVAEGGSFDFIAKKTQRAPKRMQKIGLEWLFRLIKEPWRIKRQSQLTLFVFTVLKKRLVKGKTKTSTNTLDTQ